MMYFPSRLSGPICFVSIAMVVGAVAPASAQEFLTRTELEALFREQALCYHPSDRFSCGWAEVYSEFNEDHVIMHTAHAVFGEPMEVQEYRLNWNDNALCIPYEDQGLRAVWQADGYRFAFDLSGLSPLGSDALPGRVENLRESAPQEFCFRYTIDDAGPDALFQHVFRDGVVDEALDPIALVPLFAGGLAINPSG